MRVDLPIKDGDHSYVTLAEDLASWAFISRGTHRDWDFFDGVFERLLPTTEVGPAGCSSERPML